MRGGDGGSIGDVELAIAEEPGDEELAALAESLWNRPRPTAPTWVVAVALAIYALLIVLPFALAAFFLYLVLG